MTEFQIGEYQITKSKFKIEYLFNYDVKNFQ